MTSTVVLLEAPKQQRPLVLFALFAPIAVVGSLATYKADQPMGVIFFIGVFALFTAGSLLELRSRSRKVSLNISLRVVEINEIDFLFRSRKRRYTFERFTCAVSYLTPHRFPINKAELLVENGRDGLVLAAAAPQWIRIGFFKPVRQEEHPVVSRARTAAAAALSITDGGYVGYRRTGPQVSANAA